MNGRLNLFQAAMLRWRELHPYSAVHVVRVAAPLDAARLQATLDDQLAAFGLTGLTLDFARRRYAYAGGRAPVALAVLAPEADADRQITAEIERQLNTPFARAGRIDPFRFFALARGETFDLGLAYDHFVAAGDSIVLLLKAVVERYQSAGGAFAGAAAPPAPTAPRLYPPTYRRLLFRHSLSVVRGLRRMPAIAASFRRAFRPRYPHGRDAHNGFTHLRIDRPAFAAVRAAARSWQVTLNDLLLAMVLLALSPLTVERRGKSRRNELGVASIVNLRQECGVEAEAAFGQFLSSFLITHPVPEQISLERLARDVHAETQRIKRERLYLQTLVAMGISSLVWRFLSPERRAHFHGKAYPVWAGMTSVNVDGLWRQGDGPAPPPDYLRGVSTGPLTPLVVAVTTAGGVLEMGLSFRTAAFSREDVARMAATILHCIETLPR